MRGIFLLITAACTAVIMGCLQEPAPVESASRVPLYPLSVPPPAGQAFYGQPGASEPGPFDDQAFAAAGTMYGSSGEANFCPPEGCTPEMLAAGFVPAPDPGVSNVAFTVQQAPAIAQPMPAPATALGAPRARSPYDPLFQRYGTPAGGYSITADYAPVYSPPVSAVYSTDTAQTYTSQTYTSSPGVTTETYTYTYTAEPGGAVYAPSPSFEAVYDLSAQEPPPAPVPVPYDPYTSGTPAPGYQSSPAAGTWQPGLPSAPEAAGQGGYRLVPAPDVPPGIHPNDAAPSQWFEIIRPGNGPIQIGRVSSTCVCVGVRVPNRHIAAGERALIEARTLSRTPVRNVVYGIYVNIQEPDKMVLDSDILIP